MLWCQLGSSQIHPSGCNLRGASWVPARYIPEVIVRFQLELEGCQLGASWVPARCIPDAIVRCQLGASQIHPNSYSQGCQLGASQMHPKGYSQELYRCQLGARHMHPRSYY